MREFLGKVTGIRAEVMAASLMHKGAEAFMKRAPVLTLALGVASMLALTVAPASAQHRGGGGRDARGGARVSGAGRASRWWRGSRRRRRWRALRRRRVPLRWWRSGCSAFQLRRSRWWRFYSRGGYAPRVYSGARYSGGTTVAVATTVVLVTNGGRYIRAGPVLSTVLRLPVAFRPRVWLVYRLSVQLQLPVLLS